MGGCPPSLDSRLAPLLDGNKGAELHPILQSHHWASASTHPEEFKTVTYIFQHLWILSICLIFHWVCSNMNSSSMILSPLECSISSLQSPFNTAGLIHFPVSTILVITLLHWSEKYLKVPSAKAWNTSQIRVHASLCCNHPWDEQCKGSGMYMYVESPRCAREKLKT